ncbi:MAG: MarR family transcriptional regulator [Cyclobacteriaceae bacterium]
MAAKITQADKQRQVERIGVVFEKAGISPVGGRIIGLLMMAEPPYLTFDDLVERTQASRSSVSTTLKFLQAEGLVDYITFSGDRKRYFQLFASTWLEIFKDRISSLTDFQQVLEETVALRSSQYPEFNQTLKEVSSLYGDLEEKIKKTLEDWEKKRRK